nr:flavodoxin family protein [Rhodococcus sp. HNM0569]
MIVCVSVSHGNTTKVADVMSEVLSAPVVTPDEIDPADVVGYDVVGFGSGIFNMSFHPELRAFVSALPSHQAGAAFLFSSSGFPEPPFRRYTRPLRQTLRQKGFDTLDPFSCRGFDTYLPLKLVGGVRKGRPDADDLLAARTYAEQVRTKVGTE